MFVTDDPASECVSTTDVIREVDSPDARTLAKKCMDDCIQTHRDCIAPQDSALPTRVVDCQDPTNPRLVTTSGEKDRYLALSYVWGEAQPHSTTTTNVAAYHDRIDPARLPQTIKDAISTTHAFGFRYLWTDSLCIIQDSADDKARELGKMAGIYTNAFLTIIAASASRVSEGFLGPRREVLPPDVSVPLWVPSKNAIGTVHLVQLGRLRREIPSDPISSRGWCLQERVLSSRALVYASYSLQYHCHSGVVNIGNTLSPWTPESDKRLPSSFVLATPETSSPSITSDHQWYELRTPWWTVLTDYTHRSVTVPGDKLVALAAVAEQCQKIFKTRYLAGLWEDALFKELLWSAAPSIPPQPRPKAYRAPSWSWASIDGPIADMPDGFTRREKFQDLCAEVLHCDVSLQRKELLFGEVTRGSLVVRARVVEARLSLSKSKPGQGRVYLPRAEYLALLKQGKDKRKTRTRIFEWWRPRKYIGLAQMDSSDDCNVHVVQVVFIWTNAGFTGMDGILVVPNGTRSLSDRLQYRRVGHYRQPFTHGGALDYPGYPWKSWISGMPQVEMEIV
jgi:hypothetical protein